MRKSYVHQILYRKKENCFLRIVFTVLFIVFIGLCYISALVILQNNYPYSVAELPPSTVSKYCRTVPVTEFTGISTEIQIECEKLIAGDLAEICKAKQISLPVAEDEAIGAAKTCSFMPKLHDSNTVYNMEKDFPLAFSIMAHKDLWHLLELIKLIYSPQNVYCIHVDEKSGKLLKQVKNLVKCFPGNVFLSSHLEVVYWGGIGVLRGTLNCLKDLCSSGRKWKYFQNLSAQDFPLKTNYELVATLRTWNGANNAEVGREARSSRYLYHHDILYSKRGEKHPERNIRTEIFKSPPPSNLSIFKGNLAVVLSRETSDWIIKDEITRNLSVWLEDTDIPDEHFFATIFGNAEKIKLLQPRKDLLLRKSSYVARHAVWRPSEDCGGKFIHDVCVFGAADLRKLITKDHFFANKFYAGYESFAYKCLADWYMNKKKK